MRVLHIGLDVKTPQTGLSVALASLGELLEINTSVANLNQEARLLFDSFKPDLVFMQIQANNLISHDFAKYMTESGAKVYNWTGDVRKPLPQWYLDLAPFITSTLYTNETDVETTKAAGFKADYLNIGFDQRIYKPQGDKYTHHDIVFLANHYGGHFPNGQFRHALAVMLRRTFGSRFGLYGSGWSFSDGNFMGNQHGEASVYRGAKIGISANHINLKRYSSDRNIRLMASGPMCLAERYDGIETDYQPGKHLITFTTPQECVDFCKYYLDNETERKVIAEAGCAHVHNTQTWSRMIDGLKKIYENS